MKAIKAILSGKGLPRRGEWGFTLVELLIVLAILAVLAAVVIPNVVGMMGRGAEQSFKTDEETITMSVQTFYFDPHKYDSTGGWFSGSISGHYYPTQYGGGGADPVADADGKLQDQDTGNLTLIWMGLLVNLPGEGSPTENASTTAPQAGERGPYLNEFPQSSSADNGNPATTAGTYTWVIGSAGRVYAIWTDGTDWYLGFGEKYP